MTHFASNYATNIISVPWNKIYDNMESDYIISVFLNHIFCRTNYQAKNNLNHKFKTTVNTQLIRMRNYFWKRSNGKFQSSIVDFWIQGQKQFSTKGIMLMTHWSRKTFHSIFWSNYVFLPLVMQLLLRPPFQGRSEWKE